MFCTKTKLLLTGGIAVIIVFLVLILVFHKKSNNENGYLEASSEYEISPNGSKLIAYDTIPKNVVDAAINYIKEQDMSDLNVTWLFENSQYTYNPRYPNAYEDGLFYVSESFNNIDTKGYLSIDKNGKIVEINELKDLSILNQITTQPDIGSQKAIRIAKDFYNSNSSITSIRRTLELDKSQNLVFAYEIIFEDSSKTCIDGINGDVLYAECADSNINDS